LRNSLIDLRKGGVSAHVLNLLKSTRFGLTVS
jgi:hypothetical protein